MRPKVCCYHLLQDSKPSCTFRGWDGKSANRGQLPTCCTIWRANRRFLKKTLANLCNKMQRCKFTCKTRTQITHANLYNIKIYHGTPDIFEHVNQTCKSIIQIAYVCVILSHIFMLNFCWRFDRRTFHRKNSGEWNVKVCQCFNSSLHVF